mmetsp:Transcript_39210/g.61260  ORF Transcript_39210/g.61260 Transcript_39210/m.61260 type:complete len:101 (-) Transcript_39210:345-647(-)
MAHLPPSKKKKKKYYENKNKQAGTTALLQLWFLFIKANARIHVVVHSSSTLFLPWSTSKVHWTVSVWCLSLCDYIILPPPQQLHDLHCWLAPLDLKPFYY